MKIAARFSVVAFQVSPFGADESARPGVSAVKVIRSSLWACWTPAVLRFSRIIWANDCLPSYSALGPSSGSISSSFSSTPSMRWGDRLSTVNGPATRTFFLSV